MLFRVYLSVLYLQMICHLNKDRSKWNLRIRHLNVGPPHIDSHTAQQTKVLILSCAFWSTVLASHDKDVHLDCFNLLLVGSFVIFCSFFLLNFTR